VARCLTGLQAGAQFGLRVGALLSLLVGLTLPLLAGAQPLQVGSKRFTESYILAELAVQTLRGAGLEAEHRQGLGNTAVVAAALQAGAVQLYPEYSGTLARELLRLDGQPSAAELDALLAARGLRIVARLGFHNGYALALREADAARLGLRTLSDLAALQGAAASGPDARIPAARRRLAGAGARLRPAAATGAGARPRAGAAGAAGRADRPQRRLHDRRADRTPAPARAGRRPRLLPALRRRAAGAHRPARAGAPGPGGAGGAHRRRHHGAAQRPGRARRAVLCRGGAGLPG
jgi:osmoprotectant transport system permease protein